MSRTLSVPAKATHGRDEYRFGSGPHPVLQPGTLGWTVDDLLDPEVRRQWDAGRFEIIDGVLTVMPAARFRGGSVTVMLTFILQDHLRQQHVPCKFASETDIEVSSPRVVRADAALVWGSDLAKFDALKFDDPRTDWRDYPLKLPPTLVIESISRGHELHDRRTKFRWYAEFGVQHYWIVDAYARRLDCLVLDPPSYRTDASGSGDEQVQPPAFPGLKIELRDVWG